MELTFHHSPGDSSPYVTAPSSPQIGDLIFYHSAPTSPCINNNNSNATVLYVDSFNNKPYSLSFRTHSTSPNIEDFEFQTNKIILDEAEEYFQHYQETERHPQHGRISFSSWAHEDDIFYDNKSIPLKLPPRLQLPDKNLSKRSVRNQLKHCLKTSSLREPSSRLIEFDPFMVALNKVMEEERGRRRNAQSYDGNHRRARSHSPFRTSVSETQNDDHLKSNLNTPPVDLKGSKYARYVRSQTSLIVRHGAVVEEEEDNADGSSTIITQSKMQRIKRILLKYARFGKGSNRKKGKTKNNIHEKHGNMVLVKLKPAFCGSSYAIQSPPRNFSSIC